MERRRSIAQYLKRRYGADWLRLPFHVVVRGLLTCADLMNLLLIGRIAVNAVTGNAKLAAARNWLNPVAILLVRFPANWGRLPRCRCCSRLRLIPARPVPRTLWSWLLVTWPY